MTKNARFLVVVVASLSVATLLIGGAAFYWWSKSGTDVLEAGKRAMVRGNEFGITTDNDGCLRESLKAHDQCDGFGCQVLNSLFLGSCLKASTPTEGFCNNVPPKESVLTTVTWRVAQCAAHDRIGNYCHELFGKVQSYCSERFSEGG